MTKAKSVYQDPLSHHHNDEPVSARVSPALAFAGLLVAALVLAALNSQALVGYLESLEPTPVSEAPMPLAYGWNGLMESLGITIINETIRDFITALHDFQF